MSATVTAVLLFLGYCAFTLPLAGGLAADPAPSALVLEAGNGDVFATRGVFKGERLTVDQMPQNLARAVVAIEDRRFYDHPGVDVRGVFRAALRNTLAGGTREGGSTITQQLVRMTFLSPERTLRRKVQEAMLSLWLERRLSKDEILVRYLNTAYFGAGAYGADAAARRYFGKKAGALTVSEAAVLAGLVRAPSQLAPHRNPDGARRRADLVLQAMAESGALTAEQLQAARAEPAVLRVPPETPPGRNYFADAVDADLKRLMGPVPADLTIRTTLDPELQDIAEGIVQKRLGAEGKAKNVGQAALVAMGYDGAILAMVGGRDYNESQFNRATQARRQPGSLFKLFVYLTALSNGFAPDTILTDQPVRVGDWEPKNYGGKYRGPVTLRQAFADSINTISVQLAEAVGRQNVIDTARSLGVQSELPPVPSLSLGSAEVTLIEMTRAFAAVAANVKSVEPYAVRSIRARDQALYTRSPANPDPNGPPTWNRAAMLDLLLAVVRDGTGKAARLGRPAAGKTGTTQDYRDAWFIGFTADVVVGVWVGNDDDSPMRNVVGGDLPARIWHDFVAAADAAKAAEAPQTVSAVAPPPAVVAPPASPAPPTSPPPAVVAPPPAAAPALRGPPVVLDTATLQIRGQTVRLLGVEGVGGRLAREMMLYIGNRDVACDPVAAGRYRCRVDGYDLSEAVLFNGAGQAGPDAPSDLQAAEQKARMARRGLWRQ